MEITQTQHGNVLLIELAGRLDAYTCQDLSAHLTGLFEAGQSRMVIDLARLTYISSAGLRVLLQARKNAKALDGLVVLSGASGVVSEILETAGFQTIFNCFDTFEAALAHHNAEPAG